MRNGFEKVFMGAAGSAGGAPLDVDDVFSTYLYNGTNAKNHVINNGVDLSGEGGLVWIKSRDVARNHALYDTERGVNKYLSSNTTSATTDLSNANDQGLKAFNSNGFTLDDNELVNANDPGLASWTFRKAPKFFDVVTYTGNGSNQNISHNLGCVPGFVMVKGTSNTGNWSCWHNSLADANDYILLNASSAAISAGAGYDRTVTDSTYMIQGAYADEGFNGRTYVMYLFAHNDGDGEFGPDGDQDIIKCGGYNGNNAGVEIDLGFEAQWFMCKKSNGGDTGTGDWEIFDVMRGMHFNPNSQSVRLSPNTNGVETSKLIIGPSPTGVSIPDATANVNINGGTYIYMAIRRGSLFPPEAATEVFATAFDAGSTSPTYVSGFVPDMGIQTNTGGYNKRVSSRLTSGRLMEADNTGAEGSSTSNYTWDFMNGWNNQTINSTWLSWMWKRAPGFFDVVTYRGIDTLGGAIPHNLGVPPELVIIKARSTTYDWMVALPQEGPDGRDYSLSLNLDSASRTESLFPSGGSLPDADNLYLAAENRVNTSSHTYIAYLFATLDGISKVGSVTHSGTTNVDCGFSAGARFVLLKRTDATGDWYVWDSVRGIIAGNDPYLLLNTTAAQVTNTDFIDPLNAGFTISDNFTDGDYIFYAIA